MNEKITELEASLLKKNLQIEEMEAMNQLVSMILSTNIENKGYEWGIQ